MPALARPSRLAAAFAAAALFVPSFVARPAAADEAPATRPAAAATRPTTQSRIERRTYEFKDAGKEMEYALFVPSTYTKAAAAAKPFPLVVALHGLYSNPQQIMRYPGLTEQAERRGYIVVSPMGYNNHGWYGAKPLVRGRADDPANLSDLSERDVMNVLDLVRKEYNVDPDRIYLLGHSMGGGGTWHLGIKHPDLWAALAPIAPATLRPAADVAKIKHVPVILVQGTADLLVPVANVRPWAEEMKKLEMTYEYVEVPGGDHIFVAFKNLPRIFDFFDKHKRGGAEGPVEKAK